MYIRKLGWAGVEIQTEEQRIVIDLIESTGFLAPAMGEPREPLPPTSGTVDLALLTHLHRDHADAPLLARVLSPESIVLRPAGAGGGELVSAVEEELAEASLQTRIVEPWETLHYGEVTVTALPASDGFGDPQVSWLIEADGLRILHAGDTLWHGNWWNFVLRYGAIDIAFLPINGVTLQAPNRQPNVDIAASMNPEQAGAAAHALRASLTVPIHHSTFQNPPHYSEADDATGRFTREGGRLGVPVMVAGPGEEVPLSL